MAELSTQYEKVCSTEGRQNIVQPYMWLGIEDPEGKGQWRDMYNKNPIEFAPWDMVTNNFSIMWLGCMVVGRQSAESRWEGVAEKW